MKLPKFDYAAPDTLAEALALLARHAPDARPLAGGQSLIPVLAFRLAQPSMLVDLRNVPGLDQITIGDDGVRIGARVRWVDVLNHPALAQAQPLLVEAVSHVAHYQIRNRGTVGGSLAHGDFAAELPAVALACDATIIVQGQAGRRSIKAGEFFLAPMTTSVQADELVVELHLPPWPANRKWGFVEFARQRGAFALMGVVAAYDQQGDSACNTHIVAFGGVAVLERLTAAEAAIDNTRVTETDVAAAAGAVAGSVEVNADYEAGADYRRALAHTLTSRVLNTARARTVRQS